MGMTSRNEPTQHRASGCREPAAARANSPVRVGLLTAVILAFVPACAVEADFPDDDLDLAADPARTTPDLFYAPDGLDGPIELVTEMVGSVCPEDDGDPPEHCPSEDEVDYVGRTPAQCCGLSIHCAPGFDDVPYECGCGCIPIT
jgi:hypothetical protein